MAFEALLDSTTAQNHALSNKDWWTKGTYNSCILGNTKKISRPWSNSVLPNCTGWAYGRFSEIIGRNAGLPTGNAGTWYKNVSGYAKGAQPQLGAIGVWTKPGAAGHVAVVEQINADGSIVLSESGWSASTWCWVSTQYPPNYYSSSYTLQGFIYPSTEGSKNSGSRGGSGGFVSAVSVQNKLTDFLQEAERHIGEGGDWTWATSGLGRGQPWCAAFVVAVAKTVGGLLGVVINSTFGAAEMARGGVKNGLGTWIRGPHWGNNVTPQIGDLILFRWNSKSSYSGCDEYQSNHVGIVKAVSGGTVITIEGNHNHAVGYREISVSASTINGYFRPHWARVGGSATGLNSSGMIAATSLYDSESTEEDAAVREVSYCSPTGEPSISVTDIKLSMINYTGGLSALVKAYGTLVVDTDRLSDMNAKIVCEFFIECGLNPAQAIGITGAIYSVSRCIPSFTGGICGWSGKRRTSMQKACKPRWQQNLTGQCNFMWGELSGTYSSVLNMLEMSADTLDETAVISAADAICSSYFQSADSMAAQTIASQFWSEIVVVEPVVSPVVNKNRQIMNSEGHTLSGGTQIMIPPDVNQSGITGNYTNYSYFYSKWSKGTNQRKLADVWGNQGKPSSRNIATINGYYLVAVVTTIGQVGDILTVVLEDNTSFNVMVGDAKGADAQSPWGHLIGGKVDIIEWEKCGSSSSGTDSTPIDLTGWRGKKVSYFVKHGSYWS